MANFNNHADNRTPAETPRIGKMRAVPIVIDHGNGAERVGGSTIELEEYCAVCNGYKQVTLGVRCSACNGLGVMTTIMGERILEFVQRHIEK